MAALPRLLGLLAWAPAAAAPQQGLRFVSTHLIGHQMDPRTAAGKEDFHSPYRRFHYAMYHGVPGSHTLFGQGAALESGDDGLSWRNTSYPWPFPPPAMRTNGGANGGTASAAMLPSGQALWSLGPILPSATTPGVFIAQNRTVFRADSSGGLTWAVVEQPVRFSGLPPGTLGGFPYALPPLPPRASCGQG